MAANWKQPRCLSTADRAAQWRTAALSDTVASGRGETQRPGQRTAELNCFGTEVGNHMQHCNDYRSQDAGTLHSRLGVLTGRRRVGLLET